MDKNLQLNPRFFGGLPVETIDLDRVTSFCGVDKYMHPTAIGNGEEWRFKPTKSFSDEWHFFNGDAAGIKEFNQLVNNALEKKENLIFKFNQGDNLYSTWLVKYSIPIKELFEKYKKGGKWQYEFTQKHVDKITNNLWLIVKTQTICQTFGLTIGD